MKIHLKALLVVFLVTAVFSFIYFFYLRPKPVLIGHLDSVERMETQGAPEFTAETIDGKSIAYKPDGQTVVIVNFWASWCGPCVEEVPSLIKLAEHFDKKVEVIAVSGDERLEDIQAFLKAFPELAKSPIKIVWDRGNRIGSLFEVVRLPESYILRKDGILEKKIIGSISWYTPESIQYINTLLKGP